MPRISNRRGLYVHVRRTSDEPVTFRWSIYRRRTPLGVKLTEGGFTSFHAAHAAGSKVLEELVENILKEDENKTRWVGLAPPLQQNSQRISQVVQHIAQFRMANQNKTG